MSADAPVFVFDAYGTLFDVHSAVAEHAERLGEQADAVSALWRERQLQYTWARTLMDRYVDFWSLTEQALETALARCGIDDADLAEHLLSAYRHLDAYPEVPGVLAALRAAGYRVAVFSNATQDMLADALDAAGLAAHVDQVVSVDPLRIYKPSPRAYAYADEQLGTSPGQVRFHSSNPWDAAGAGAFGWAARWINRNGAPREYSDIDVQCHSDLARACADATGTDAG